MHWFPKHPSGSAFIVTAPKCYGKPLYKSLTFILRLTFKRIEAYNDEWTFCSDLKVFWAVSNNQLVIDAIVMLQFVVNFVPICNSCPIL